VETGGDAHDGWDFDCEWDGSLISPDGAGPAAEEDPAAGTVRDPPASTAADQCWVGLGPSSDLSTATHSARGVPSAAAESSAKSAARQSPDRVPYPALFTGRGSSGGSSGRPLSPSNKREGAQRNTADAGKLQTDSESAANKGPAITADSTWTEVQQVLGDGGRATIHSRGFASNPFGPTLVYGYRGVAFEALKNGHLAGLTLFQV